MSENDDFDLDDLELSEFDLDDGFEIEDLSELDHLTYEAGSMPFDEVIEALRSPDVLLSETWMQALSDLGPGELERLRNEWPSIGDARRVAIMQALDEFNSSNWAVDGRGAAEIGLDDPLSAVRSAALQVLVEDCPTSLVPRLLALLGSDDDENVRASAAATLGQFTYLTALEELPETIAHEVEQALLTANQDDASEEVVRSSLEALGYLDQPDVQARITRAYEDGDPALRASAVKAMARSLNRTRWSDTVVDELQSDDAAVCFQAIVAAGELQIEEAQEMLLEHLLDSDIELRDAAVWALGEIGGPRASQALEALQSTYPDDDNLLELIDDALANIQLESTLDIDDDLLWSSIAN